MLTRQVLTLRATLASTPNSTKLASLFEYNKNYSRTLFLVSLSTFEREITSTNSNLRTVASSLYFALGVNAILAVAFGRLVCDPVSLVLLIDMLLSRFELQCATNFLGLDKMLLQQAINNLETKLNVLSNIFILS
jgi:hypothetical protein